MKLTLLNGFMLIAGLSAIELASVSLDPMPSKLYAGDAHKLSWTTDRDYDMELLLVRRFDTPEESEWEPVQTVFKNRAMAMGSDTYNWTVPDVRYGGSYALWLDGSESPGCGYGNRTNWFQIDSPANSRFSLDLGQIIGAVAGASAALLLGAVAIEIMLRLTRNAPVPKQLEAGESREGDSFDSISDEKAKAECRYQLY